MLFFDKVALTSDALLGDLLILLAVLVWGCHVVYIKKIIEGFHPIQVTLYPISMAAPMFLLSGFLWDGEMVRFVDASIIKAMLYQTLGYGILWFCCLEYHDPAIWRHSTAFICIHYANFRRVSGRYSAGRNSYRQSHWSNYPGSDWAFCGKQGWAQTNQDYVASQCKDNTKELNVSSYKENSGQNTWTKTNEN